MATRIKIIDSLFSTEALNGKGNDANSLSQVSVDDQSYCVMILGTCAGRQGNGIKE